MRKILLTLILCLFAIASLVQATEKVPINTWVLIGKDELGNFNYFSSASIKQYSPNDYTVFEVTTRGAVSDEARKKDKNRFARVSYFVIRTHYDLARGVYQIFSTIDYDAQGKIVRRNDEASTEMPIEPNSMPEQTLIAVQTWIAKNILYEPTL